MNASAITWRDGIIIRTLSFRDVAAAKRFVVTYNRHARLSHLRSRALLVY